MKNVAIVLAAGQGKRMNSKVQKQYLLLKGKPILYYTLNAFEKSPLISEIVLVTGKDEIEYCQKEIVEKYGFEKVRKITAGGKERYYSVYEGIKVIEDADYVFIHDGARPFVDEVIIERVCENVQEYKACVVGMPVKDTIKVSDENAFCKETPPRSSLWMIQTPQTFSYQLVKGAYECVLEAIENGEEVPQITDDAMMVEYATDTKVKLVQGDYRNIKITTPEDLSVASTYLKNNLLFRNN